MKYMMVARVPARGSRAQVHANLQNVRYHSMATNPPAGDGHRKGQVRDRSQVHNEHIDRYIKRDTENGQFIAQKKDGEPFKGVRKEK